MSTNTSSKKKIGACTKDFMHLIESFFFLQNKSKSSEFNAGALAQLEYSESESKSEFFIIKTWVLAQKSS